MFEINVKPREFHVLTKNRQGKWTEYMQVVLNEPLTLTDALNFIDLGLGRTPNNPHAQCKIVTRNGEQLISSGSMAVLSDLNRASLISVCFDDKKDPVFFSDSNVRFKKYHELRIIIRRRQGIRSAKMRTRCIEDDMLAVWDIAFNDGTTASIATYITDYVTV